MGSSLEEYRKTEIEAVRKWFEPGCRVLEIGGGSGWQASLIADWGCTISSIDVEKRSPDEKCFYDVHLYDGIHIPFDDDTFDFVVSSNVLEHVRELPLLLKEMRRVLKPGGRLIHILPSSSWRLWTMLAHYGDLLRRLQIRMVRQDVPDSIETRFASPSSNSKHAARKDRVKSLLVAEAHGEYSSAAAELYHFSRRRWLNLFRQNKFKVIHVGVNELFYTGYILFPNASLKTRRSAARLLGSSCHIFVMVSEEN